MKSTLSGLLIALVIGSCSALFPLSEAMACAACRNPTLPAARPEVGPSTQGSVSVSASLTGTAIEVAHSAGCADLNNCSEVTVQPEHNHKLFMLPFELSAGVNWSVSEQWVLSAHLPLRLVYIRAGYETPDGEDYTPLDEGIHHRTETLFGLGDARLSARTSRKVRDAWVTPMFGVSLPTGVTRDDPYALGAIGVRHQHVQRGTGTFMPFVGLDVTRGFQRTQWSGFGQVTVPLYENNRGFRAPVQGLIGVSGGLKARNAETVGSLGLEYTVEGPEIWNGIIYAEEFRGRHEIYVSPRVTWRRERTTHSFTARFAVFRTFVGGTEPPEVYRAPVVLSFSTSWASQ